MDIEEEKTEAAEEVKEEAAEAEEAVTEAEEGAEAAEAPEAAEEASGEEAPGEEAAGEEAPAEEKKKGLFGRNREAEKAKKAQAEAEAKLAAAQDQVQRTMAEFDNFRKRTEKEKSAMFEVGARSMLEKLLPIVDSFERGLGGLTEEQKAEPFAAGMDKVYRQFLKMFEDAEVKPIEAVGKTFDPALHNAVMHIDDESVGENVVVEEFMKGYTYRGTVIRYSMVKVAN